MPNHLCWVQNNFQWPCACRCFSWGSPDHLTAILAAKCSLRLSKGWFFGIIEAAFRLLVRVQHHLTWAVRKGVPRMGLARPITALNTAILTMHLGCSGVYSRICPYVCIHICVCIYDASSVAHGGCVHAKLIHGTYQAM